MNSVFRQVGKIDIFVWSAGISPAISEVKGYGVEEFQRGFDLVVVSAFNAIQTLLPLAAPNVRVFNISTGIAHMKPIKGLFNYATTNLAATKLLDYAASETPALHVVHIQPGVILTEMNAETGVEDPDERKL